MYSIGILSAILFVLVATTNALECRPLPCMIHCHYGFDVDTQGCPICSCRRSSNVCIAPIIDFNCGSIDSRDCPSSHECQLDLSGHFGQCCLKRAASSTVSPQSTKRLTAANTTTTRHTTTTKHHTTTTKHHTTTTKHHTTTTKHHTTTTKPRTTTRRAFNLMFSGVTGAGKGSSTIRSAGSTTRRWFSSILF